MQSWTSGLVHAHLQRSSGVCTKGQPGRIGWHKHAPSTPWTIAPWPPQGPALRLECSLVASKRTQASEITHRKSSGLCGVDGGEGGVAVAAGGAHGASGTGRGAAECAACARQACCAPAQRAVYASTGAPAWAKVTWMLPIQGCQQGGQPSRQPGARLAIRMPLSNPTRNHRRGSRGVEGHRVRILPSGMARLSLPGWLQACAPLQLGHMMRRWLPVPGAPAARSCRPRCACASSCGSKRRCYEGSRYKPPQRAHAPVGRALLAANTSQATGPLPSPLAQPFSTHHGATSTISSFQADSNQPVELTWQLSTSAGTVGERATEGSDARVGSLQGVGARTSKGRPL